MNINIKEFKDATFLLDEDDINDDLKCFINLFYSLKIF